MAKPPRLFAGNPARGAFRLQQPTARMVDDDEGGGRGIDTGLGMNMAGYDGGWTTIMTWW